MRKEIIWVVGIGVVIGIIVTFGIYRINFSINKNKVNIAPSSTPNIEAPKFKITLDKPENNDVLTQASVTVSGITKALAWITVSGESGDYIIQSGSNGAFSQDIDLTPGVNQIKLTAFDPEGAQSIEKVIVVYSSSFQPVTFPTPSPNENITTDSAIRQKVAEKVRAALDRPKAYIGVVTDIADSTIQIKNQNSEIKQISTGNDNVAVVSSKGKTNKAVKLTDIAIGDFIVAMGYINSNSVLVAQRILITDPATEPKIDAAFGKVTETTKKDITVNGLKDGTSNTVTPDKDTDISGLSEGKVSSIKFASIKESDLIIYVTDRSPTTPVVRSIFIVQGSEG